MVSLLRPSFDLLACTLVYHELDLKPILTPHSRMNKNVWYLHAEIRTHDFILIQQVCLILELLKYLSSWLDFPSP